MNPGNHHPRDADNLREMIGGYASANLSPQEKEKLFHAALQDQDLFDALMEEQALKDFLELPGVKAQLIEALQPQPTLSSRLRQWIASPAAYATAGALAAAVLIVVIVNRPPSRQTSVEMANSPKATQSAAPSSAPLAAEGKREPMVVRREASPEARPSKQAVVAPPPLPQQKPEGPRQQPVPAPEQLLKSEQAALRDEAQQPFPAAAPPPQFSQQQASGSAPSPTAPGLAGGVIGGALPSPAPTIEQPLSVTYTLLHRVAGGGYLPVTTPAVTSTDSLRLEVTPNNDGDLYLYARNEAGLETTILNGVPLSRGQTTALPQSGGFSGASRLVLVFRRREPAASEPRELASQAFRQRARAASEKDKEKTSPPPSAAVLPAGGLSRASARSPAAREVSVEITINTGAN